MLKVIEGFVIIDNEESSVLTYNEAASLMGLKYADIPNHEMDYRAGRTGVDGLFAMAGKVDWELLKANDLAIAKVVTPVFDDCRLAGEPEAGLIMGYIAPSTTTIRSLMPFPDSLITRISIPNGHGDFSVIAKPSLTMYGDTAVEGFFGMYIEACVTAPTAQAPAWNVPPPPPAQPYFPPPAQPQPYYETPSAPIPPWAKGPAQVPKAPAPKPSVQPSANEVIRGMFPLF